MHYLKRRAAIISVLLLLFYFGSNANPVTLEGKFGKVVIDTEKPALTELYLRCPDGSLELKSLLSPIDRPWLRDVPNWGTQAYTYVIGSDGTRYESRKVAPASVIQTNGKVEIKGVQLVSKDNTPPLATEDWTLESSGNELKWTVRRTWHTSFRARLTATPALFFSNRPYYMAGAGKSLILENCVSTTVWFDPDKIKAGFDSAYRYFPKFPDPYPSSTNNRLLYDARNGWAIYKLWTNWHNRMDLRLQVSGGFLMRRGWFGWISEAGSVSDGNYPVFVSSGEKEEVSLQITGVDKYKSGHQLCVTIPDKEMEASLKSWYGSLLNGGVVCDGKNFDMGNEVDGCYYGGASWMHGVAIRAGCPVADSVSQYPFNPISALKRKIRQVGSTLRSDNRTQYGYNSGSVYVDDNLHQIIATRIYMLLSGDLAFVRQQMPTMERMVKYYIDKLNSDGLFDIGPIGYWYYDIMPSGGITTYYNTFLYKALTDLADMQVVSGAGTKSAQYKEIATKLKNSINKILWNENAPGGPRYTDWIRNDGIRIEYAADICQFAPVALGIASEEQGKKLLATLDKRIAELQRDYGYTGQASLSAYWPVPDFICVPWMRNYTQYMNGGSFLCQTFWEIMARVRCGDSQGAYNRLKRFSEGAQRMSYTGNNWIDIQGNIGWMASDEPYLSDMVAVAGSLTSGIMGITPSWNKLEVNPLFPIGWDKATADIVYKGFRHQVSIDKGKVSDKKMERVIGPVIPLEWEIRPFTHSNWGIRISRYWDTDNTWKLEDGCDIHGGEMLTLKKLNPESAGSGYVAKGGYITSTCSWGGPANHLELWADAKIPGGVANAIIEVSDDNFKTIKGSEELTLSEGEHQYLPGKLQGVHRDVRIRFKLQSSQDGKMAPNVLGIRLKALPI